MENYKRISDDEIRKVIDRTQKSNVNDESAGKDAIVTILETLLDVRQFMRKIYKEIPKKPRVYKRPTGRKEDIIVGGK